MPEQHDKASSGSGGATNGTATTAAPSPFGHEPATAGAEDLSAEIIGSVERKPGDIVRCTRIGGNGYRCNWWAPVATGGYDNPGMSGLMLTTHRVRQSHFLRVTKAKAGGLVIRVVANNAPVAP